MIHLLLIVFSAIALDERGLRASVIMPAGAIPRSLIVGRASCGTSAWLLTEDAELIEIPQQAAKTMVRAVTGLLPRDRVWGLACLSDGSLWTLADPRAQARLDRDGRVQERVATALPKVALFGAGDALLFQQLPMTARATALFASPPRRPEAVHPWPGLAGRPADTREHQIARNLVNCGVGFDGNVPCWFAGDRRFAISDGRVARTVAPPTLQDQARQSEAPIWDVALAGSHYWLIAGEQTSTGPAGARLLRVHERTGAYLSLPLDVPARVIVSATDTRCRLLNVNGELIEVVGS